MGAYVLLDSYSIILYVSRCSLTLTTLRWWNGLVKPGCQCLEVVLDPAHSVGPYPVHHGRGDAPLELHHLALTGLDSADTLQVMDHYLSKLGRSPHNSAIDLVPLAR